jgi:transposase
MGDENKTLREDNDLIRGYLRLNRHNTFGCKSEKTEPSSTMPRLPGFEDTFDESYEARAESYDTDITQAEEAATPQEPSKQLESIQGTRPKNKPGRKRLPPHFERVRVVHDLSPQEKTCACGNELHKIGEVTSEQLEHIPVQVRVIQNVRYKYGCKACEETVKLAPLPPQPIPKSIATSGLLAHVLVCKYQDHLPLYRQSKMWERVGVDINKGTMSHWVLKCGSLLAPLVELLKQEIVTDDYVRADETTAQVLKEPGRKAQTNSYMWVYMTGSKPNPCVVYEYQSTRASQHPKVFLAGFSGYLQIDAYQGYNAVTSRQDVISVGCFAHCKRKFNDVLKMSLDKQRPKQGKAFEAITVITKLYEIERIAKDANLTPDEIKAMRLEKSKPILDAFKQWIDIQVTLTAPKTPLGKAFRYASRQWVPLTQYLKDGRLNIDNNACERAIRPFAVGRKNWLFMGNVEGAKAAATVYSLIETCKANGVDAYRYLHHVLQEIRRVPQEDLTSLLPWNYKLPDVVSHPPAT